MQRGAYALGLCLQPTATAPASWPLAPRSPASASATAACCAPSFARAASAALQRAPRSRTWPSASDASASTSSAACSTPAAAWVSGCHARVACVRAAGGRGCKPSRLNARRACLPCAQCSLAQAACPLHTRTRPRRRRAVKDAQHLGGVGRRAPCGEALERKTRADRMQRTLRPAAAPTHREAVAQALDPGLQRRHNLLRREGLAPGGGRVLVRRAHRGDRVNAGPRGYVSRGIGGWGMSFGNPVRPGANPQCRAAVRVRGGGGCGAVRPTAGSGRGGPCRGPLPAGAHAPPLECFLR